MSAIFGNLQPCCMAFKRKQRRWDAGQTDRIDPHRVVYYLWQNDQRSNAQSHGRTSCWDILWMQHQISHWKQLRRPCNVQGSMLLSCWQRYADVAPLGGCKGIVEPFTLLYTTAISCIQLSAHLNIDSRFWMFVCRIVSFLASRLLCTSMVHSCLFIWGDFVSWSLAIFANPRWQSPIEESPDSWMRRRCSCSPKAFKNEKCQKCFL